MALLSISEPGQSKPKAHAIKKRAVGIDLGTTNSLVAVATEGHAHTLCDHEDHCLVPSVVHYAADGKVTVGYDAALKGVDDSANTISSVKRLMGRGFEDIHYDLPYEIEADENGGMPLIKTAAGKKSPVEVSAEILKSLVLRGEEEFGDELDGAVITVPAYFDEAQRQATKDAARLAGIKVLRLLGEPTAAAIAYGLDRKQEETVIIYDLGGGTFDVSLMRLEKGVFKVLATGGDAALGGDDLDRTVIQWILAEAGIEDDLSYSQLNALARIARHAKHALSDAEATDISFEHWSGTLSRELFNNLIDSHIDKTIKACRRVLRDAKVELSEISDIVMVGGSTRTPRVRERVSEFFGAEVHTEIDPDKVVAVGAALQADVLAGNKYGDDILLLDVIPLSLGIETMGGLMEKIIPRNTTIPVARAQQFTTYKDGQSVMSLHVLQGERELVSDCRSLAKFELRDIPPMVAGAAIIEVTYQVDADGLMEVHARELSTGIASSVVVKPSYGLEDKDIEKMITDSYAAAASDKQARSLQENKVEAERIIEALQSALALDGKKLLSDEEYAELSEGIEKLHEIIDSADSDAIHLASESLNEASLVFAGRRMDTQIKTALAGHSIEEIER
ncbi:MAG: Fe-S protein assembly chaperone HscA [Gammaproteobacteria bacterium]|nr:Fe-S protein assembly chaperone HscA [Gammaproteobacteria bacterium]MBT6042676.1 Fe-S protein assembly chaperone HscA [Gammaproteobacteria bacterium]